MLSGLYSAATALHVAEQNQEVVARNLAHVNVSGYRRGFVVVESLEDASDPDLAAPAGPGLGAHVARTYVDFAEGTLEPTGRNLDVALSGDGFFVVDGPEGPLYSRNGSFYIGQSDQLVDVNGRTVQGEGGPITVPPSVATSQIQVTPEGSVIAGGVNVGSLRIVSFADNDQLNPVGTYSFAAPPGSNPEASTARVIQGSRELSNVNPVEELVRMTIGLRQYEAAQRVLRAISESVEQNTSLHTG